MFRDAGSIPAASTFWQFCQPADNVGQVFKRTCERQPGGKRALDCFLAVSQLVELLSITTPDVDDVSADNLERDLRDCLHRLTAEDPTIAIDAVEQLGWQVISRV